MSIFKAVWWEEHWGCQSKSDDPRVILRGLLETRSEPEVTGPGSYNEGILDEETGKQRPWKPMELKKPVVTTVVYTQASSDWQPAPLIKQLTSFENKNQPPAESAAPVCTTPSGGYPCRDKNTHNPDIYIFPLFFSQCKGSCRPPQSNYRAALVGTWASSFLKRPSSFRTRLSPSFLWSIHQKITFHPNRSGLCHHRLQIWSRAFWWTFPWRKG